MKSHVHSFPLKVCFTFFSELNPEFKANEANIANHTFLLLTFELALLASCSSLPQYFYLFFYKGHLFPGRERSCRWLFYHRSSFVLDDDKCGSAPLSMTSEALLILMVHHCRQADNTQPLTEGAPHVFPQSAVKSSTCMRAIH